MDRRQLIAGGAGFAAGALGIGSWARAQQNASPDTSFDPSIWMHDLAIVNARVITMDPRQPEAQAVLVRRGRIQAVGSNAQIRSMARGVRVLDASGRGLVPGFVDTHIHMEWSAAATVLMLDLHTPEPKSVAEVLARVKTRADQTPAGKWVVAEGRLGGLTDKRMPTLEELDAVSTQHPIAVFDGVHAHVANSPAAQAMGYLTRVDEAHARNWSNGAPFAGGLSTRDEHGHPGVAYDMVMRLPKDLWSVEELKGAIRKVAKDIWVAGGVTSASPVCLVSSNEYSADQQLHASGELPLRMRAYYMCPMSADVDAVLETGVTRGFGNDMFRTGGFKLVMDSRLPDRISRHYTPEEFTDVVTKAHARGLQTITHTLSEDGADIVTAAIEEVRRRFPNGPVIRHRIEHHRPQLQLAKRQTAADMYFTMIAPQEGNSFPGDWSGNGAPYRSYISNGVHPILMSDKCGGGTRMPRPLFSIAAACNDVDHRGTTPVGETVAFDDALRMWTIWAAESTHQEHDRGSITRGKLGDFALLSADPRRLDASELFGLKVDATILGGQVVFES
jgi:predicted amidohydrolase YtcJ